MTEEIIRLAARGDGVTASGRFSPGAAPGDMLAEDGALIPGPNRITPACRHFGKCGGCQFQHVGDALFSDYIVDRITEALKAQRLILPEIRRPHLSPPYSRRRVSLRAMKMGRRVVLGFAEARSHHLIDLMQCPVMHPDVFTLIAPLRMLLGTMLKDRRPSDVRMTLSDQGVDLMISGVAVDGLEATEALTDFAQNHKLARLSVDEGYGVETRWEPAPVTVTLGGVAVGMPEGAFLQATADGEAALVAAVREAVRDAAAVADLFAGLGTFTFANSAPVHAVEGVRDAVLALQQAANRTGRHVTVEHRDLFRRPLSTKELAAFECVIIDPPRAGSKEQVEEIAASLVPRVVSVSCNPATFARDAKILVDSGYRFEWIQPVGQFRWSTHVELAACFSR